MTPKSNRRRTARILAMAGLIALILSALLASTVFAEEPIRGRWFVELPPVGGEVELTLNRRSGRHGHWNSSFDLPLAQLRGFSPPSSAADAPVHFELTRDAGTLVFDGHANATGGSGRFIFSADRGFEAELAGKGYGSLPEEKLYAMAIHDVGRAFLRELAALGYERLSIDNLLSMRIHSATPEFIRELKTLGYSGLSSDDLVSMRIHGATPEFVRELKTLGYGGVSADDLVSMRIHGVSPEFIRELKALGYTEVPADNLVSMRIHGVTADFIRQLAELGYRGVPIEKLVSMRIHNVTIDYVRKIKANDPGASPDELVNRRIHDRR